MDIPCFETAMSIKGWSPDGKGVIPDNSSKRETLFLGYRQGTRVMFFTTQEIEALEPEEFESLYREKESVFNQ